MAIFSVPDMSCDHCTKTISEAIHKVDDGAEIDSNLDNRTIDVQSTAGNEAILLALKDAGYPAYVKD